MLKKELTVIDFFCGAGGFSEGFRQQGFKIIRGIDFWQTAINSHNLNHKLTDETQDILSFWSENSSDIDEINKIENSSFIIGSPSCVSFSSSNKSGKADKSLGIKLIEAYLRVVAVKKHQKDSKLLAWYMENVPNSQKHVKESYSFEDLNLGSWAETIGKNPGEIALKVKYNGAVLNSGDYGAPQSRLRFICGEWCETGEFLMPKITHDKHVTVGEIKKKLPPIILSKKVAQDLKIKDPNYPKLQIKGNQFTDHFYDTGLYKIEWESAEDLKLNNPCMGKMAFPENEDKPCRTIMATRSAKTREALIYKSEYNRKGNGEYRLPTIREIASLMGFPIVYQFVGSEGSKWRQIGNAVSPHLSSALAKAIRKKMELKLVENINFEDLECNFTKVQNLNTFQKRKFDTPKTRQKNAKFRRPILKKNNITVDLMNFNSSKQVGEGWYIGAFFGTGKNFKQIEITKEHHEEIEILLHLNFKDFQRYKENFLNLFKDIIGVIDTKVLQEVYEKDLHILDKRNPINLRKNLYHFLRENILNDELIKGVNFIPKDEVPKSQLLAIYSLGTLIFK